MSVVVFAHRKIESWYLPEAGTSPNVWFEEALFSPETGAGKSSFMYTEFSTYLPWSRPLKSTICRSRNSRSICQQNLNKRFDTLELELELRPNNK
jgi:hypothetical protein